MKSSGTAPPSVSQALQMSSTHESSGFSSVAHLQVVIPTHYFARTQAPGFEEGFKVFMACPDLKQHPSPLQPMTPGWEGNFEGGRFLIPY